MRVTRPTMNLSSIASPMTSTWAPANAPVMRRARSGASGGSSIGGSREGQRNEDQEEHQKLGVTEIVFKQSRAEHGDDGRQRGRGQHLVAASAEQPPDREDHRDDQPQ